MYKKILELHRKHHELINYLVTGGIGTVVSIGSFAVLLKFSNESVLSNVGSWIITIILMYVLNRYFVFLEDYPAPLARRHTYQKTPDYEIGRASCRERV